MLVLLTLFLAFSQALDPNWKLFWSDEFDGSSLDLTKWNPANGGNEGNYTYTLDSLSVSGGSLIIQSNNVSVNDYIYTSGKVDSSQKFNATYGRWEVRAKVPRGQGMWPALWFISEVLCWPYGAEFDILELLGKDTSTVYGTYHYGVDCGTIYDLSNGTAYTVKGTDLSADYHIYAIEWFPTNISWFLDDTIYHVVQQEDLKAGREIEGTPHFWILNTQIGGSWGGDPDSTTVWPQYFYIDYVRNYVWDPCNSASGCGLGCCNVSSDTCICDSHVYGSTCEYDDSEAIVDFRDLDPVYQGATNSNPFGFCPQLYVNSKINQLAFPELTLLVTNTTCPSFCNGKTVSCGGFAHSLTYLYGTYKFNVKLPFQSAMVASGTALILAAEGSDPTNNYAYSAARVIIQGSSPGWIAYDTFKQGQQFTHTIMPLPGIDFSLFAHDVWIEVQPNLFQVYVDGVVVANTTDGVPNIPLGMSVATDANSLWYGRYNIQSASLAFQIASMNYSTESVPAQCPTTSSSSVSTTSSTSSATVADSTSSTTSVTMSITGSTSATTSGSLSLPELQSFAALFAYLLVVMM